MLRYPTPIRLRPLSLLAISLTTSDLILDPNWGLLVGLLVALLLLVLMLLTAAGRFVRHRWEPTRASAGSSPSLGFEHGASVALTYKEPRHVADVYSRFLRPTGSTEIVHYRLRDDILDNTVGRHERRPRTAARPILNNAERCTPQGVSSSSCCLWPNLCHVFSSVLLQVQVPYDALADVKPALDRLHVEIDIQDLRVVQASPTRSTLKEIPLPLQGWVMFAVPERQPFFLS